MKINYCTFGCKVNQYETENLRQKLTAKGWETTESAENADVFIVNTCTVTAQSDKKLRQTLGRLKKASPNAVTGFLGEGGRAWLRHNHGHVKGGDTAAS